jgi:DNA-binding transcriptional ArsR family regulator
MSIPNTTPTPNELYNGEMRKMSDAELRVVLLVTRATLGWELDNKTGMRKIEDWISHSQIVEKTGKSSRAISYAITSCVKNGWIETRDQEGNILKTPNDRKKYGKKIYYRLGKIFLDKVTIAKDANLPSQSLQETIANNDIQPSQPLRTTKETLTKENNTKLAKANGKAEYGNPEVNSFLEALKKEFELGLLDGSAAENRKYAWLAIKKCGRLGVALAVIKAAAADDFYGDKIASAKKLYYHMAEIVQKARGKKDNVLVIR